MPQINLSRWKCIPCLHSTTPTTTPPSLQGGSMGQSSCPTVAASQKLLNDEIKCRKKRQQKYNLEQCHSNLQNSKKARQRWEPHSKHDKDGTHKKIPWHTSHSIRAWARASQYRTWRGKGWQSITPVTTETRKEGTEHTTPRWGWGKWLVGWNIAGPNNVGVGCEGEERKGIRPHAGRGDGGGQQALEVSG